MRECVPGLLRASWPRHAAHRSPNPGTAALSYPPQGSADRALAGLWVPVLPPRQGRRDSHRQDGSHRGSHARASGGCAQTLNEVCGMFSFFLIINCSRVQWTLLTQLVRVVNFRKRKIRPWSPKWETLKLHLSYIFQPHNTIEDLFLMTLVFPPCDEFCYRVYKMLSLIILWVSNNLFPTLNKLSLHISIKIQYTCLFVFVCYGLVCYHLS